MRQTTKIKNYDHSGPGEQSPGSSLTPVLSLFCEHMMRSGLLEGRLPVQNWGFELLPTQTMGMEGLIQYLVYGKQKLEALGPHYLLSALEVWTITTVL